MFSLRYFLLLALCAPVCGCGAGNFAAAPTSSTAAAAAPPILLSTSPGIVIFGDSIACGYGGDNTYTGNGNYTTGGWTYIVQASLGAPYLNNCVGGDQIADAAVAGRIYGLSDPTPTGNPTRYVGDGDNDAAFYGSSPSQQALFQSIELGALYWLGIPSTSKNLIQTCTHSAGWLPDNTLEPGMGLVSSTQGGSITCLITTVGARPIVGGYIATDGNGGGFTITIDGNSCGAFVNSAPSATIQTHHGVVSTAVGFRCPATAGSHTVTFTVSSASSPNNVVPIQWLGTPAADTTPLGFPTIVAGGVIHGPPSNPLLDALSGPYSSIMQALVAQAQADGLRASFFDNRDILGQDASDFFDTVHPNQTGYNLLAAGFLAVARTSP